MRVTEDLVGRRFGKWTVAERVRKKSKRGTFWRCVCDCGWENVIANHTLMRGKSNSCRRCSNVIIHGAFTGSHWCRVVSNAKSRGLEVTITPEYANELYESQGRRCALTGVPICFSRDGGARRVGVGTTASLDRIDSRYGYVPGNVRWVHRSVNIMRLDFSDVEFVYWCRRVSAHTAGTVVPPDMEPPCQARVSVAKKRILTESPYPGHERLMEQVRSDFPEAEFVNHELKA